MRNWKEVFHGSRTVLLSSTGGDLDTNSYVIVRDFTLRVLVDPYSPEILRSLRVERRVSLPEELVVIFTHLHPDHVSYLEPLAYNGEVKVTYLAHPDDLQFKTAYEELARQMGLSFHFPPSLQPLPMKEWDLAKELGLELLHTPGHTPGSVSIILREGPREVAIVGDLLFKDGIGRWDLPGGDFYTLSLSIKKLIRSLSEKALILPGHGPVTTLERELSQNPYLADIVGSGGELDGGKSDWI